MNRFVDEVTVTTTRVLCFVLLSCTVIIGMTAPVRSADADW